jgi:GST-like protein
MSEAIELYFWATPNCWKISVALEEMVLADQVRPVAIVRGEQVNRDFLALSPNNRVPAIVDRAGPGGRTVSLFESGAILQYLGRKSGLFYPPDEASRAEIDQWLFWQTAGLGPMFGQASHYHFYAPALVDDLSAITYATQRYDNEVNRLIGVLEVRLADRSYVAGDYSIADMAIHPWLATAEHLGQDLSQFPRVAAWLERVGGRDGVIRGMAVGAEFRGAPPEKGTEEQLLFARSLFGQTAASVAAAAAGAARK